MTIVKELVITMLDNREMRVEGPLKVLLLLKKRINNEPQVIEWGDRTFARSGIAVSAKYKYYQDSLR